MMIQTKVLLMYSMPLTNLVILRGFSIQGVIICYSIAIMSIAYSLYLVDGWLDIYTLYQGKFIPYPVLNPLL